MKDYYKNTREYFDLYNSVMDKIANGTQEITEQEAELLDNHSLYVAHALIQDYGPGSLGRETLAKIVNVIKDIII